MRGGLATRKPLNWRIPLDLLARVDRLAKRSKATRSSVFVDAVDTYLNRVEGAQRLAGRGHRGPR